MAAMQDDDHLSFSDDSMSGLELSLPDTSDAREASGNFRGRPKTSGSTAVAEGPLAAVPSYSNLTPPATWDASKDLESCSDEVRPY